MRIATKSSKLNISKLENTKKIADIFAKNIFKGNVILFYGEIGVGKTTFIKFLVNITEPASFLDSARCISVWEKV